MPPDAPTPSTDPSEPPKSLETPPSAPAAPPSAESLDAQVKNRLEAVIAGKNVSVRFKDRRLEFKAWGLRKNLQLGSKVLRLSSTVQTLIPAGTEPNLGTLAEILSFVANDVIEIVAASISSPFRNADEAEAWLDENVEDMGDLFDLAYIVYDQNLRGDALGKLTNGVESLGKRLTSLSTSSSKN
jgi:hypothetical protein